MSDKDETKTSVEAETATETPVTEAPVAEEAKTESKSEAKRKAVVKEAKAKKEVVEEAPAEPATDGEDAPAEPAKQFVLIRSADKRQLEASIGDQVWKGVEISVPVEQAGDVRRLLEDGGFFLKD